MFSIGSLSGESHPIPALRLWPFIPYKKHMRLKIFCLIVALGGWFPPLPVFGNDEVCVACDKKVLISGEFSHQRAWGVTTIEGATWRGGEAFREEIYGTNFTLSVSGLLAGKYGVVIGVAEVDFTNAGQRVFDITCGDRVLASKSRYFCRRRRRGKSSPAHQPG